MPTWKTPDAADAQHKAECLARWRERKPKRVAYAQQIIDGQRTWSPAWPAWVRYDIEAEMDLIEADRAKSRADAKARKARRENSG